MEDINKYQKSKVLKETLQFLQFFLVLSLGIVIGIYIYKPITAKENTQSSKFDEILSIIHQNYIDTVGLKEIEKNALDHLLSYLDPHSVYIPKEELSNSNEDLLGKFYGIGIEFMIQKDTLKVVSIIKNGPSEQAGLQSGDKIIKIDDSLFSGKPITNLDVLKKLKGGKNTKVKVSILRKAR
ncbi:MAG: PDZ domain-containing protein [Chitinophagales bacterium]|nr:PDZ domain-containing protein [Chitinophagales bacterium]